MPITNANKTTTITPALTTEPEGRPTAGISELPVTLPDYDPPVGGEKSGNSGGSTGSV